MKGILLLLLFSATACFSQPVPLRSDDIILVEPYRVIDDVHARIGLQDSYSYETTLPLKDVRALLQQQTNHANPFLIQKVLTALSCLSHSSAKYNAILTIIDYSLPSSEKRLWVYDLKAKKLLFHTYVSHGIKSGTLLSKFFSNRYNSKSSSIGLYTTEKSYYGREGISLRLEGLERGFNDNASNRAIVMHGGWYMDESFIKKYGRSGRSWGCPAVPLDQAKAIINTIKDESLLFVFYPDDQWFLNSKFLNCDQKPHQPRGNTIPSNPLLSEEQETRDPIIFVDLKKNHRREESDPILAISAIDYQRIFKTNVPLGRMLRRPIENKEYIALNHTEFNRLLAPSEGNNHLNSIFFIIPVIKMVRGYYETEMKIVDLGKIKEVKMDNLNNGKEKTYTLFIEEKPPLTLRTFDQFIRWIGL